MSRRVAVLMGGWSSEREVSLTSGRGCAAALGRLGYDVVPIDVSRDVSALLKALSPKPDAVFNALHGRFGEDGCVQGLLNILGIPYTHSGLLASAIAMDKPMARTLFAARGLRVAEGKVVHRKDVLAGDVMARPYVVKPTNEGSSVGVRIVRPGDNSPFDAETWPFGDVVLVEQFIPGRELTVGVMGDRALGVTEIRPRQGFYDYAAKYTEGKADHLIPAPVAPEAIEEAKSVAIAAHQALGCRGVSRADFRYDDTAGEPGRLVLLEINTQPGMTPLSLVPEQAAAIGISYDELVGWLVENAACDS
jgi:D-alanine-D-alanine ligase